MNSERGLQIAGGRVDWVTCPATTDVALIRRMAEGDRLAMQVLFGRHHIRLYRFLLRLVNNSALAEDLIGEVFLEVWRRADKFRGRCQVSTWVMAIARRKAYTALRKRGDDRLDETTAEAIADDASDPERMVHDRGRSMILRDCLEQLSPDHREVIDLVYYHEKSIEEVATIIGVPKSTVKSRMFYARKRLADLLAVRSVRRDCLH